MIQFQQVDLKTFLSDYWQKKPLLIKNALPNFITPVSPEELAGLSLEEEVESRIVIQHSATDYELQTGPFDEDTYESLPEKNWTLLVQGMDRLLPEVADLLKDFDFIPQWRIDDIMISYATEGGNVGPHFDHYDVFLLQAQGKRRWMLSAQDCDESNYIKGVDLRLMQNYVVEDEYIVETGDILYIPPKWGHHGVGLTDDCMTFSVGYRTYRGIELWDSFGDYLAETESFRTLYQDPNWNGASPGQVTDGAWQQAKTLLQSALNDDMAMKRWFGRFATQLDDGANRLLPTPLDEDEAPDMETLISAAYDATGIVRDEICRFAYAEFDQQVALYVNSQEWPLENAQNDFIRHLCNFKVIEARTLQGFLEHPDNHALFYSLWVHQYISFVE
ncbi:cupin domain-containing protein [Thiosulfativibrio zosterae]|uniref:Cupin n=1 Tax=Thiosulfativibrio zosterae TaxID=2675053 RepID=A0A6F8PNP0_9GAMM|nr:cupin domain-containing protein [Thiosulfativibrio zosterae]BBP43668.1 cupin [Thiosulfativibrio zosterae]